MPRKGFTLQYLQPLSNLSSFTRNDLFQAIKQYSADISESTFKAMLQNLLIDGQVFRVGRNAYCVADDMIVIEKLVSEAPRGKQELWHTRLEKLLVDVLTDDLIQESVSEAEWPKIYEDAFQKYAIDESCFFRYAKRKGAEIDPEIHQRKNDSQIKIGEITCY